MLTSRSVHVVNILSCFAFNYGCIVLPVINEATLSKMNPKFMMLEELELKTLKLLELNPHLTQRELASELGISLGKTHYVIKALINIGWLKLGNFQRSDNKLGYAYFLTPKGLKEKTAITRRFLVRKQDEYKQLRSEIELLQLEVGDGVNRTSGI